jgi:hypothetical protein
MWMWANQQPNSLLDVMGDFKAEDLKMGGLFHNYGFTTHIPVKIYQHKIYVF